MNNKLPVNPQIIQWARTSLGLSLEDVAQRMKKSVSIIQDWETGNSSPTYVQLETLAYKIYKRPIAIFFFPEIPTESSPVTEFRTLPDEEIKQLPSYMIKLYRKAKVFQFQLEELYEGKKPVEISLIDRFTNQTNFNQNIAIDIRNQLGISLEEQFSWNSCEIAFKRWRNAVEKNGIFIFKDSFRDNYYSGFCIYHEIYPIIYINNWFSFSRQIFTIFHELWHLLEKKGGIGFRNSNILEQYQNIFSEIEVKCNKFAGELLVPSNSLTLHSLTDESVITKFANRYSVSREVILRKYLDKGLIDSSTYRQWADKWIKEADEKKRKKRGGNYYLTQKQYLGENYINLVMSKYYQNKISLGNLSEYLHIKEKSIASFEHYVLSSQGI